MAAASGHHRRSESSGTPASKTEDGFPRAAEPVTAQARRRHS